MISKCEFKKIIVILRPQKGKSNEKIDLFAFLVPMPPPFGGM